jgi:16S rRNA (adenine1518-N6/adenine1519-N6)-dimethyltransferase
VRIEPLAKPLVPANLEGSFRRVVNQAFSNRRKTVRRALTGILDPAAIAAAGIDGGRRPEELAIDEFLALARAAHAAANPEVVKAEPRGNLPRAAGDAVEPVDDPVEQR